MISFSAEQRFIVTGASSGIGAGIALLLNELGASVIAVGQNEERLHALKEKAAHPEYLFPEQKNLAEDIESLPKWVTALKEKYGKFQGMACCAGVSSVMPLKGVSVDDIKRVFEINYFANVFLAKGFTDKRNNNGAGSSLVCIASAGGVRPDPGMTSYAGSKAALIATMQSIAREYAPAGIRVNCVSPALIQTGMADEVSRSYAEGKYPLGLGQVDDVANMVIYLLSDKAKWITVQNYVVDCGAM